jgi:large subunit ribosomal protein L25
MRPLLRMFYRGDLSMSKAVAFAAEPRQQTSKGAAKATRRAGRVPGIIYGNKQDPVLISVDAIDLTQKLKVQGFFSHVYEITVDGKSHRVLARDLQLDPVTDFPIHVDFMRFSAATRLNIEVDVHFENEEDCPGLRQGGVLNVVRHAVELLCAPDSIPEYLAANLAGLEIGDSIHISAIALPEDVQLTITDRDFTIATIAAPTVVEEVEVVEDGEVEGEDGEGDGEDGAETSEDSGDGGGGKSKTGE